MSETAPWTWEAALEWAAEWARSQRCICDELVRGGRAVFCSSGHYTTAVKEHDPACPRALLAAIKEKGR